MTAAYAREDWYQYLYDAVPRIQKMRDRLGALLALMMRQPAPVVAED